MGEKGYRLCGFDLLGDAGVMVGRIWEQLSWEGSEKQQDLKNHVVRNSQCPMRSHRVRLDRPAWHRLESQDVRSRVRCRI